MTGTMDEKGLEKAMRVAEREWPDLGLLDRSVLLARVEKCIRAYLSATPAHTAAAGDGCAVSVEEWPKEVDERVLIYVVHDNAQYEKDAARRLSEWEGWFTGYWTDFNAGGWIWNGMAGRVTHVASLPPPPAKP